MTGLNRMFLYCSLPWAKVAANSETAMLDQPLTPASHADVVRSLAYALRYDRSGERVSDREPLTATLTTAEHLADALRLSGFVVMRKPPLGTHADTPVPNPVEFTG